MQCELYVHQNPDNTGASMAQQPLAISASRLYTLAQVLDCTTDQELPEPKGKRVSTVQRKAAIAFLRTADDDPD
jgi:hypothetical protein